MNPTGSGLERASRCAASCVLPRAGHTGEAAIKGNDNHEKVELGLAVGGDLTGQPEVVQKAMAGAVAVDVEVAYAIDVEKETARVIGRRMGRNYGPLSPSEIALTVDAVIDGEGVTVWDWKSRKRVTPAKHNLQVRAGCVAVMKTRGLSEVGGAIGYLADGEDDAAWFDSFDAATFFADMRSMLNRIGAARALVATGGVPEVASGPWCDYCPSMAYCPAKTRLAMSILGELDTVRGQIAFMSVEQVSKAYDKAKEIETLLETVMQSIRDRISQEYIPRPNGKRLALVECERKGFDTSAAKKKLEALGESLAQFEKVTRYTQVKEINVK